MFRKTELENGQIEYEWRVWTPLSPTPHERSPTLRVQTFTGHPYQFVEHIDELIFSAADDGDVAALMSLAQVLLSEFRQSYLDQPQEAKNEPTVK